MGANVGPSASRLKGGRREGEDVPIRVLTLSPQALREEPRGALVGEVARCLDAGEGLVLDLCDIDALDGAGLAMLLHMRQLARDRHLPLKLCAPKRAVRLLLLSVRFHRLFGIYNDPGEARASFR